MRNGGQVQACPPSANIWLYGSSILHPKGRQRFYIFTYASRNPGIWAAKNPDKIGVFAEHIFFMFLLWRRVRDSNPRDLSVYSISSAAPSTTRTTLRVYFRPLFSSFPKHSKILWREKQERKLKNIRFEFLETQNQQGFSRGRNSQIPPKFRVSSDNFLGTRPVSTFVLYHIPRYSATAAKRKFLQFSFPFGVVVI